MLHKSISPTPHFGDGILDALAAVRIQLQWSSDRELAQFAQALIGQGFNRAPVILERTGDLGGIVVQARMKVLLDRHDQDGVGDHLWNVTADNRYELVEGGNA